MPKTRRQHAPAPTLVDTMLTSIRRDSYIMEANAFPLPAIGKQDELAPAVALLVEQLNALFGRRETFALLVMDAHQPALNGLPPARNVAACFGSAPPFIVERPDRPVEAMPERLDLTDQNPSDAVYAFARSFCGNSELLPRPSSELCIVSPYVVRPIEPPPSRDYASQITGWASNRDGLMLSRPMSPGDDFSVLTTFEDYYFAAFLLVYLPSDVKLTPDRAKWLEVIWVLFQMSWGFPILGRKQDEIDAAHRDLAIKAVTIDYQEKQRDHAKTIHALAVKVTGEVDKELAKIKGHLNELVRAITPVRKGAFDSREFHRLFAARQPELVWQGKGEFKIYSRHDYHDDTLGAPKDSTLHYGVLEMLRHTPIAGDYSPDELMERAKAVLRDTEPTQTGTESGRAFLAILNCLVGNTCSDAEFRFKLMKMLTTAGMNGREIPYYAFAARLLVGQVPDDFEVLISTPKRPEPIVTVTHQFLADPTFLDKRIGEDAVQTLFAYPTIPVGSDGTLFAAMFQSVVDFIAHIIQKTGANHVCYIKRVNMKGQGAETLIECTVDSDQPRAVTLLLAKLSQLKTDTALANLGDHNTHVAWSCLLQFSSLLSCEIPEGEAKILFRMKRPPQ